MEREERTRSSRSGRPVLPSSSAGRPLVAALLAWSRSRRIGKNTAEFVAALVAKRVLVSLGHTHASPEQIHSAAAAGASLSTHVGNGIAGVLPRHPNPIWAQLADDRLTATFIADGHHLPADTLKAMVRAKTIANSILVSDVTALAECAPGIYHSSIGGEVELHADGSLRMAGNQLSGGRRTAFEGRGRELRAFRDLPARRCNADGNRESGTTG